MTKMMHFSQTNHRVAISLVCGLAVPLHRQGIVPRHARAVAVEDSEVALGIRIALLRGLGSFTGVRNNGGSYYRP